MNNELNIAELQLFMPSSMMHNEDDEVSVTYLSNGTTVISDRISDTYITELSDGVVQYIHCDHFGCKTDEDFERLNHECFVHMLCYLDEDELEKARQVNGVDAISDLFVFQPTKEKQQTSEISANAK